MTSMGIKLNVAPWQGRLHLPAYQVGEAARYSGVSPRRVSYWHSGAGKAPTLPGRPRGPGLSYYQLVEVAFVATFRNLGVSMKRIRQARNYAAQMLESEYPFAQYQWMTEGFHLLLDLSQLESDASVGRLVVADRQGQLAWQDVVSDRFHQFDYVDDTALVWHLSGRDSPVTIDPRVSFGAPNVKGIPTWVLKGRWDSGESIADIQDDFGLNMDEIRYSLQFEGVLLDDIRQAA